MKKILGYITVFFVFFWTTTANAGPIVASITNSNGVLTIDGFSSLASDGDGDPSTINFLFNYTNGASGTVSVLQPIPAGNPYKVAVGWNITGLGSFSTIFNIMSQNSFAPGSASIDAILGGLFPSSFSGSPLGSLTVQGTTLDLLSVMVGGTAADPTLKLATKVTSGTTLNTLLTNLDGLLSPPPNGSVTGGFTDANLTVSQVPEPTALLLLCVGLLGILSFSTKRA